MRATMAPRSSTSIAARLCARAGLVLSLLASAGAADDPAGRPLTLAAAMSLRRVMPPLTEAFRARDGGAAVHVSYAASGNLRMQVEAGAPIDAVVLADALSVDQLVSGGHAEAATRRVVATNTLVLIGPEPNGAGAASGDPLTFATIERLPEGEMISIGEPGAVPAGRYAKAALERLGKWNALTGRIVFGGHVGAVLNYVRRGEVAAAIVYGTETRGVGDVRVLDHADRAWAPTPEIVAAVVTQSRRRARARAFIAFLATEPARQILADYGFGTP